MTVSLSPYDGLSGSVSFIIIILSCLPSLFVSIQLLYKKGLLLEFFGTSPVPKGHFLELFVESIGVLHHSCHQAIWRSGYGRGTHRICMIKMI